MPRRCKQGARPVEIELAGVKRERAGLDVQVEELHAENGSIWKRQTRMKQGAGIVSASHAELVLQLDAEVGGCWKRAKQGLPSLPHFSPACKTTKSTSKASRAAITS